MNITDTHCHLDLVDFDDDRDNVLIRCFKKNVSKIIIPAIKSTSWSKLIELCKSKDGLYPALGLHPVFIEQHQSGDVEKLDKLVATVFPIAIGEIGLDFYLKELDRDKQIELFEQQLLVAKKYDLPVILHVRKAHDQVLQLLRKTNVKGGFCHAFNGSLQQAEKYIELGFKLGFGGTLTYQNSTKLHKLAKELPLEAIVLETDAPDMVVESHRGERNSPEYVVDALAALAKIRNENIEVVAQQTTQNADDVVNFSEYDQRK